MFGVCRALKGLLRAKPVCIDHWVFRLHYKSTALMLLFFSIVICVKQYFGQPIQCVGKNLLHSEVVDTYCLVTSTFTVRSATHEVQVPGRSPHPGIVATLAEDPKQRRYHTYYQWTGAFLFLQALLFCAPHCLWKRLEGATMAGLLGHNGAPSSGDGPDQHLLRLESLVVSLKSRWGSNMLYALKYCCCELLCLLNVVLQVVFLDCLFDHQFTSFGTRAVRYWSHLSGGQVSNPFDAMFPKVAACTYAYFGENGKMVKQSFLCVLTVNVVSQKVYLVVWFWFMFLIAVTAFAIVFKGVAFPFPRLRVGLLRARFRSVPEASLQDLVASGSVGDWFLVYLLAQNLDEKLFGRLVVGLLSKTRKRSSSA